MRLRSPFPGMDPYLEHPELFGNLHDDLIFAMKETLHPRLPDPYYARSRRRTWVEISDCYVEPDVNVQVSAAYVPKGKHPSNGGVAVADAVATEPIVVQVPYEEHSQGAMELYAARGDQRRLVTTIELLSPTNKTHAGKGWESYRKKQQEMLETDVHFVEIDLLRGGKHSTSVPPGEFRRQVPSHQYHVCVHRFDRWGDYLIYPFTLRDSLPTIEVPLLPEDGTVTLDLQAVFNRCYEVADYSHDVDYQKDEIVPPLSDDDAAWARRLIEAAQAG